mgnify:CR=1 FL=1
MTRGDDEDEREADESDLEPGFYRAEKPDLREHGVPPAYFQVTETRKAVLVYSNGEVVRNDAAILLLQNDILPVSDVEPVEKDETPFADDVEPRPMEGGPDPVQPVE